MKPVRLFAAAVLSAFWLAACGNQTETVEDVERAPAPPEQAESAANVDDARLLAAAETPQDWLTYNGNYDEQRHSGLTGITKENISELALPGPMI